MVRYGAGCLLLLAVTVEALSYTDPKIDIVDVAALTDKMHHLHPFCRANACPSFAQLNTTVAIRNIKLRRYDESAWLATQIYQAVNGSCIASSPEMRAHYRSALGYFKGLNKMGLTMERTLPVRVESRPNHAGQTFCYLRFFLPSMDPMPPPAPIVTNALYVGVGQPLTCYVMPRRGPITWQKIMKLHQNLVAFLNARGNMAEFETTEIIADIFRGYGVPGNMRYVEVLVCQADKSPYYDW